MQHFWTKIFNFIALCGWNPEKVTLCKINFCFVAFPCPENVNVPLWRFALISIPLHAGTSRQHPSSSHLFFTLPSGQEPPSLQPSALVTLQPLPDPHLCPPEAKALFSQSFSEFKLIFWCIKIREQTFGSSVWQCELGTDAANIVNASTTHYLQSIQNLMGGGLIK